MTLSSEIGEIKTEGVEVEINLDKVPRPSAPPNSSPRWPFSKSYFRSWYLLAYSDEVKAGDLKTFHFFGQDLVAFRTNAGEAVVVDPFCPHLGAHLGYGGTVVGDNVQCPFHGWQFGSDGSCSLVPSGGRVSSKAKLNKWQSIESDGQILIWFSPDGAEPAYMPAADEEERAKWSKPLARREWIIKTKIPFITENALDGYHFDWVHKIGSPNSTEAIRSENGIGLTVHQTFSVKKFGKVFESNLDLYLRDASRTDTVIVSNGTIKIASSVIPIDEKSVRMRFEVRAHRDMGSIKGKVLARLLVRESTKQFEQDIDIWENMVRPKQPLLVAGESGIGQIDRWLEEFQT